MSDILTKPRFFGHETFPLRYGWLEKITDFLNHKQNGKPLSTDLLKPEERSVDFGLGINMAKSIKYWAYATKILNEKNKELYFSTAGNIIFGINGKDKYLENINSIWYLHWKLATNANFSTTWYWFFNHFQNNQFDREKFFNELIAVSERYSKNRTSYVSIKRDLDCFIRTYVSKTDYKYSSIEDALESPFIELGLIKTDGSNNFSINSNHKTSISSYLIALSILYYHRTQNFGTTSISIDNLLHDPLSPGRIFILNKENLLKHLEEMKEITDGLLYLDMSSGLSQIIISKKDKIMKEDLEEIEGIFLEKIYE